MAQVRPLARVEFGTPLVYLSTHFIRAKEYLEAILASTTDAIVTTDGRGRVQYFSPGAERLFGRRPHEALGLPVSRFYAGGVAEARRVMRLLGDGPLSDYETVALRADGARIPISMSAALLRERGGALIGTLGISKDISRRVELERRLRELSITDDLTGLFNQRHYHARAAAEVERAQRQGLALSVLLIDLDRFKEANDRWGHLEGDRILRETADILRGCIRRSVDLAFRYGGDEFIVLLPGIREGAARAVAARVRAAAGRREFSSLVGLSAGVATLRPEDGAASFLRRADARMYAAKRRARRARPLATV